MARTHDEAEAAYFTLLRAREELTALRRYDDYLGEERRRLRRFMSEGEALADTVDAKVRRPLRHTWGPMAQAVRDRIEVIEVELTLLDERIEAAEQFVAECEAEHDRLKRRA